MLYENKKISDQTIIENAKFISNINAALEERDKKVQEIRHNLLEKIRYSA